MACTLLVSNIALSQSVSGGPGAELKQSQPADVAALIDRVIGCNHWQSEPSYSAARTKEINDGIAELGCQELPKDEIEVLRRHSTDASVRKAISAAHKITL